MTVAKLIKILSKCDQRAKVCVDKETLYHPLTEANIIDIDSADEEMVRQLDDDGGSQYNKDGVLRERSCVVLSGEYKQVYPIN